MMSCAHELSPGARAGLWIGLTAMVPKTAVACMRAEVYMAMYGSMPADERAVCGIVGVSLRYFRDRVWPEIEYCLSRTSNGKRYTLNRSRDGTAETAAEPPDGPPLKNPDKQRGAHKMHELRRARLGNENVPGNDDAPKTGISVHDSASDPASPLHQNSCRTDADNRAITMQAAYNSASVVHDPASPDVCTPTLSLSEVFLPETLEKVGTERESAPAGVQADADAAVDAEHAAGDADDAGSDAPGDARPPAPLPVNRKVVRPAKTFMSPDWKPRGDIVLEIEARGVDPQGIAAMFRAYSVANSSQWADWDAAYALWWARERKAPVNREMGWMQSVPVNVTPGAGGSIRDVAAELAAETAVCAVDGPRGSWARAIRTVKKGLSEVEFRTWLGKAVFVGVENGEATVTLPSLFTSDFVKSHWGEPLTRAIHSDDPSITSIRFEAVASPVEMRHRA